MKSYDIIFGEGWHKFLKDHPDTELIATLGYGDASSGYGQSMWQNVVLQHSVGKGLIFGWRYHYLKECLHNTFLNWLGKATEENDP